MRARLGRRRFVQVVAAASALAGAPASVTARDTARDNTKSHDAPAPVRWRGQALGARAEITIVGADPRRARSALAHCLARIEAVESWCSLFRADSVVSRLNRTGFVEGPPPGLVALLRLARRMHRVTGGAFDVTVQPLWEHYRAAPPAQLRAPPPAAVLARVGDRHLEIDDDRLRLAREGAGVTLNGIAQGHAADLVAATLAAHGFADVLVNVGEFAAAGRGPRREPWRIGVEDPVSGGLVHVISINEGAVATSSPLTTRVAGDVSHILDPRVGASAPRLRSVSVVAGSAAIADALSTALVLIPRGETLETLRRGGARRALIVDEQGTVDSVST